MSRAASPMIWSKVEVWVLSSLSDNPEAVLYNVYRCLNLFQFSARLPLNSNGGGCDRCGSCAIFQILDNYNNSVVCDLRQVPVLTPYVKLIIAIKRRAWARPLTIKISSTPLQTLLTPCVDLIDTGWQGFKHKCSKAATLDHLFNPCHKWALFQCSASAVK